MASMTMVSGLSVSNAAPLFISRGTLHLRLGRPNRLFVRCSNGEQKIEQQPEQLSQPTIPSSPSPSPPPTKPIPSPKFWNILSFSGPAPERINGRLAMIGFVAAIGMELASGDSVVAQLANGGISWFVATAAIFSLASLIPLLKGVSAESKSGDIMSSDAELWNGRFAMLGLVALVFTEYLKGGALV